MVPLTRKCEQIEFSVVKSATISQCHADVKWRFWGGLQRLHF